MAGFNGVSVTVGCPARTGIHLMHKRTKAARSGPPRSHGDPPLQDLAETTRPARTGIDREQPSFLDDEKGSPARTGMYPRDGRTKSSTHRAPRADGDPPDAIEALRVRIGVAPGARGSTVGDRLKQRVALGCPARTGIHLGQTCAHPGRTRLPRARGSTAGAHRKSPTPRHYPARTGIDQRISETMVQEPRAPQARG